MTVPPILSEPTPSYDLPKAPEPRAYGGWIILAALFTLMIGLELVQYFDRPNKPSQSKYLDTVNQLKLGVELRSAFKSLGSKDDGLTLSNVITKDLERDAFKNEVAARIFAATKSELGQPIPEEVIKVLRSSKEPRDKVFADVFAAKTLTKKQAQKMEVDLKEGGFISKLAVIQAFEKAGDTSKRAQLLPASRVYIKMTAMFGVIAAAGIGCLLWLIFLVLKAQGKLPQIGLPLERISLADADRLAFRCAQVFAIFLGMQFVVMAFIAVIGTKTIDKHTATLLTYAGLVGSTLAVFKLPIGGKRFTLADIGIHSRDLGKNVGWGVATALANLPIVFVVALLGQLLFSGLPKAEHPITTDIQGGVAWYGTIVIFLAGSVGAPILEEIMFRGTLLPALARTLSRPVAAILIQGLLFAAIHPTGIPAWLPLAAIGSMSGFLSRQTGSLVSSMVMHGVHNFGTLLFALAVFS